MQPTSFFNGFASVLCDSTNLEIGLALKELMQRCPKFWSREC